jgi:hypothetical protein
MNDVIESCKYHQHQDDRQMAMTPVRAAGCYLRYYFMSIVGIGSRPSAGLPGTLTVAVA